MSIEEDIKKLIDESNRKGYFIYNIADKSQIGYIETIHDLKENMIINFETKVPKQKNENIYSCEKHIDYKARIIAFELDAVSDLNTKYEEMKCYVEVIED